MTALANAVGVMPSAPPEVGKPKLYFA